MASDMIRLTREGGMWVATATGALAVRWTRLFGTATLPTPFASSEDEESVFHAVAARNPGALVLIEGRSVAR